MRGEAECKRNHSFIDNPFPFQNFLLFRKRKAGRKHQSEEVTEEGDGEIVTSHKSKVKSEQSKLTTDNRQLTTGVGTGGCELSGSRVSGLEPAIAEDTAWQGKSKI